MSELYVLEFYSRITKVAQEITDEYEIIFVNDASPDASLDVAVQLHEQDEHVKVIDLSRNFGHHKAMMTGLEHAKGDFIFLIDSDLEEEPELLTSFWGKLQNNKKLDVVYGVQESRKGSWFERFSGELFYKVLNKLSQTKLPANVTTARLTTQRYNQALLRHKEREMFIAGLWEITGFDQEGMIVRKHAHSTTTYSIRHKVALLVNAVTSFSNAPLKLVLYTGFFISTFSALFVLYVIVNKLIYGVALEGWSSLIASVWFLGGLILFSVGVVGLYIAKIFTETKQRPYTIVKHVYKKSK